MEINFNNLYTHFIFVTQNRLPLIREKHRERIEKYITGIVNHCNSKMYSIYANPEHMHFIISRSPGLSELQIATVVADSSEKFINQNRFCIGRFTWQNSAAAFSVSKSDIDRVCKYILNQATHHHKVTFAEEYDNFLKFYESSKKSLVDI